MIDAVPLSVLLSNGVPLTMLLSWRWSAGFTDRNSTETSSVAVASASASRSVSLPCVRALLAAAAPVLGGIVRKGRYFMIGAVTLSVLLSSGIPFTMLLAWHSGATSSPFMDSAFRVPALLSSGILFTMLLS